MAFDIGLLGAGFLVLSYMAFAGLFLHRYFRPKEWAEWLVEGSVGFFLVYALTMFVLLMSFFIIAMMLAMMQEAEAGAFIVLAFIVGFLIMLLIVIRQVMSLGGGSTLPFAIYLLTMAQEIYHAISSPDGFMLLFFLVFWYFVGVFAIFLGGNLMGLVLGRLFPEIEKEHLALIRKRFGPHAPKTIVFSDGSSSEGFECAGAFAGMGVMYSLWMIAHVLLLSLIL